MENIIKISVILPVYNAGIYLSKCLYTLINQTLKDIEIIVVLDCPTDGSEKIAEKCAQQDNRVKIIYNEINLHIGESRNRGLEIARGKYIAFCDHDDYLDLFMYEKMYNLMELNDFDMVCSPYVGVFSGRSKVLSYYPDYSPERLAKAIFDTTVGIISSDDEMKKFMISGVIWNKLFKLDIIRNNNIGFVDTRKYTAEDLLFLMEYTFRCIRIGKTEDPLYYHNLGINNTGASYAYHSPQKVMASVKYMRNFIDIHNLLPNYEYRFNNSIRLFVFQSIAASFRHSSSHLSDCWKAIKKFEKDPIIMQAFKSSQSTVSNHSNVIKKLLAYVILFFYKIQK